MRSKPADDPLFLAVVAAELGYASSFTLKRALAGAGIATFLAKRPYQRPAWAVEPSDLARFRVLNSSVRRVTQAPRAAAVTA